LIPPEGRGSIAADELKVDTCGISPTFPCTNAFFTFAKEKSATVRLGALRSFARKQGWRVERTERFAGGVHLDVVRKEFHARYTLGKGLGGEFVDLKVAGPLDSLPAPTAAERSGWSSEKRRYVQQANAICSRALARMTSNANNPAPALRAADRALAALDSPDGEEREVASFLRPLNRLAATAQALADEQGEDTLPLAVGIGLFAKRFNEAASRYGLERCVFG
jgi:hypothetical protein